MCSISAGEAQGLHVPEGHAESALTPLEKDWGAQRGRGLLGER